MSSQQPNAPRPPVFDTVVLLNGVGLDGTGPQAAEGSDGPFELRAMGAGGAIDTFLKSGLVWIPMKAVGFMLERQVIQKPSPQESAAILRQPRP